MKIDRKLISHLERLARIELSPEAAERIGGQLERIVAYVQQLQNVDTTGVSPTSRTVSGEAGPLREDRVRKGLRRDDVLAQSPDARDGFFCVPRIFERGES